jgi:hypothetical protein
MWNEWPQRLKKISDALGSAVEETLHYAEEEKILATSGELKQTD